MANSIDAIVQARLGSTRFPKKLLEPLCDKPLLGHVIERLQKCSRINRIIVATTTSAKDDAIEKYCTDNTLLCHRGPEDKVLDRFLDASNKYKSDRFLRVCSDNPFIDVGLMDAQIQAFKPEDDYCSYFTSVDEPIIIKPVGLFAEAVTRKALQKAARLGSKDPRTQEHVTYYLHSHPDLFRIKKLDMPEFINPELRFTVDYREDIAISEYILNHINSVNAKNIMDLVGTDNQLSEMITEVSNHYPKLYSGRKT